MPNFKACITQKGKIYPITNNAEASNLPKRAKRVNSNCE